MYITGSDLRKMRLEASMTTVKMADLAGVKTRKTYENWEKNIGSPSMNQLIALCSGCNIDAAKFVEIAVLRGEGNTPLDLAQAALN